MDIAVRQENDLAIVSVKGRIVRETRDDLRIKLEEIISKGVKGIALDFEGVEYMDSAGLGCCASMQKLIGDRNPGRSSGDGHSADGKSDGKSEDSSPGLLVMFGASPSVEKMWRLIRLDLAIPFFHKEKEARERLKAVLAGKSAKTSEAAEA